LQNSPPDPVALVLGQHVHPLDLCGVVVDRLQRTHTGHRVVDPRDVQPAPRAEQFRRLGPEQSPVHVQLGLIQPMYSSSNGSISGTASSLAARLIATRLIRG
jgi:hypothetical protein